MSDKHQPIPPHELSYLAKELNAGIRQLLERVELLREELYLAAKAQRSRKEQKRARPMCGVRRAAGGKCPTRLEPGQFRCDIHARELSAQRTVLKKAPKQAASPGPEVVQETGAVTSNPSRSARV